MTRRLLLTFGFLLGLGLIAKPSWASAASLYFSPSSKSIAAGSTTTIALKVNTAGQAINSAEATIVFSTSQLQLISLNKGSSIFSFWAVQPNGSNASGRISFSGGLPSPGYTGSSGTIVTMTFKAIAVGKGDLSITGGKVLANDGNGTDLLSSVGTGAVTITPAPPAPVVPAAPSGPVIPVVSSPIYLDENSWYRDNQATVTWTKPTGAIGFSYDLTQDPNDVPDHVADTKGTSTTVQLTSDGVWYFSLQAQYANGWSDTRHFRMQHDQTAPLSFSISVTRDRGATDPTPQLEFSTTDATSGIDDYTLSVDNAPPSTTTSPTTLNDLTSGTHTIIITAVDKAGNTTSSQIALTQVGYPAPIITDVTSPILLLDRVVVKGLATAGDSITVLINGQPVGQTVAGQVDPTANGVTIRTPWTVTSERLLRPGHYAVTAVAIGPDGQASVASDPVPLIVSGHSIFLGGQAIATVAVVPIVAFGLLGLAALLTWVMIRLFMAVKRMHDREVVVEEEIDDLRRKVRRKNVSGLEVEESLEQIERDLVRPLRSRRSPGSRRSPRRR